MLRIMLRMTPDPGTRRPLPIACVALAALLLTTGTLTAQTVERRVEEAVESIDRARAEHVDIISPRNFERAARKVTEARQKLAEGGRIDDIDRQIQEAYQELGKATALLEVGDVILADALTARGSALAVNAPEYAEKDWEDAEKTAREAGRRIESNDQNGARERAARAESEYGRAELNAIRADLLGRARELRDEALEARADRRAPRTLTRAFEYRRAARLAEVADSVDRNRVTVEDLALRDEAQVARLADELRFEPEFAAGIQPVVDEALVAIESLYGDRDGLQRDLEARGREITRLSAQVDSIDGRLAEIEQREATVAAELRERQRQERRLREVQAVFSPDEGEALLGENRLILRLNGLTFASGSAEIRPDNFSILTKVQRVIREFPESGITVEGHTDSQGNEAMNQDLSRRRAIAVREYLLSNMAISADRISAVGYGESRPVAPNVTERGRTQNRRIDVTLSLE